MPSPAGRPERRRMPRLTERCRVTFRVLREGATGARTEAGETVNLSGSGLCLLTREAVARGTRLALELRLEGRPQPVVAMGTVVWTAPERDAHKIGIEFAWLRPEDQAAIAVIADYVRGRLGE